MFKNILIIILLTQSLLYSTDSQSISDRALFKIQDKILWAAQVNQLLSIFDSFYCLNSNSPYFKIIKMEGTSIPKDYKQIFEEKSPQFPISIWAQTLVLGFKLHNYLVSLPNVPSNKTYANSPCVSNSLKSSISLLEKLEDFVQSKYSNNDLGMLRFFKILLGQQNHEFIFSTHESAQSKSK